MAARDSGNFYRIYGDTQRHYFNPLTGDRITRNQFRNMAAKELGFRNITEYDRLARGVGGIGGIETKAGREFGYWYGKFRETYGIPDTGRRTVVQGLQQDIFMEAYTNYKNDPDNMEPGGPLANLLEYIGVREVGAQYSVGETPRKGKR